MARGLKFLISENKGTEVTVQLICAFVFADAKRRFSHEAARITVLQPIPVLTGILGTDPLYIVLMSETRV